MKQRYLRAPKIQESACGIFDKLFPMDILQKITLDPKSVAKALLEAKKNSKDKFMELLQTVNGDNRTILHLACGYGHLDIVRIICESGVDLNPIDSFGETPIYRALRFRRDCVMDLLLTHGIQINLQDSRGRSPLHRACQMGTTHAVLKLLDHGADVTCVDTDGKSPLVLGQESKYAKNTINDWEPVLKMHMDELEFGSPFEGEE